MDKKRQQQLQQMRYYNDQIREQTTESERNFMVAAGNITVPQLHVLLAAANHKPCTMSMIAKATHLTHGNITQTVERLEAKKLLKRVHCREDRRVVNVELTAKGVKITTAYEEGVNKIFSDWFDRLESDEIEQLLSVFEKIAN